MYKMIYM